jgi:hypothetical protein
MKMSAFPTTTLHGQRACNGCSANISCSSIDENAKILRGEILLVTVGLHPARGMTLGGPASWKWSHPKDAPGLQIDRARVPDHA